MPDGYQTPKSPSKEKPMATQAEDGRAGAIPETHRDILEKKGLAQVATIGPGGEPQSSPVWFGWDGTSLKFSHLKSRQKYRNLAADPRVAVSITDPDNPYRYLEIRGEAEIEDDPEKRYIDEMAQKYMGRDYPANQPGDERIIVKVRPQHVTQMG